MSWSLTVNEVDQLSGSIPSRPLVALSLGTWRWSSVLIISCISDYNCPPYSRSKPIHTHVLVSQVTKKKYNSDLTFIPRLCWSWCPLSQSMLRCRWADYVVAAARSGAIATYVADGLLFVMSRSFTLVALLHICARVCAGEVWAFIRFQGFVTIELCS